MRFSNVLLMTVALILVFAAVTYGQDPGEPDTIYIGCPIPIGCPRPDSIAIPVYIWADEPLAGFSLGFEHDSPYLSFSSISTAGTVIVPGWFWGVWGTSDYHILFGAAWTLTETPNPQGLLVTMYLQVDPSAPASVVDVDSVFIPPAGDWVLTAADGWNTWSVYPQYRDCGSEDMVFEACSSDADDDGIPDDEDNCPNTPNPEQEDADQDGIGDVCDECTDTDDDGYGDPGYPANTCPEDNCPSIPNPNQEDADNDGTGDLCDECTDTDNDGFGDPGYPNNTCDLDNCPDVHNPDQFDPDGDSLGTACDNCPDHYNPDQTDTDGDQIGDACDYLCGDANSDGISNITDAVYIISYIFDGGPSPDPLLAGDCNCDGIVNITDAVYLITYIFDGGPAPCDPDGDNVPDC